MSQPFFFFFLSSNPVSACLPDEEGRRRRQEQQHVVSTNYCGLCLARPFFNPSCILVRSGCDCATTPTALLAFICIECSTTRDPGVVSPGRHNSPPSLWGPACHCPHSIWSSSSSTCPWHIKTDLSFHKTCLFLSDPPRAWPAKRNRLVVLQHRRLHSQRASGAPTHTRNPLVTSPRHDFPACLS